MFQRPSVGIPIRTRIGLVRQFRQELGTDHETVDRVATQLGYGVESAVQWKYVVANMRCASGFAVLAVVLAASACGGGSKSSPTSLGTPQTVGPRARASERVRSAALVKEAQGDFAKGRTDLAKSEFEAAVAQWSDNKYGWFGLGVIAQDAKDASQARTDYDTALAIDPHFESALYNYGVLLYLDNDLDQAITYLDRAVRENDTDANAHWDLGLALAKRNHGDDSKRSTVEFNKALELNPRLLNRLASSPSTTAP
jgi:Tfp pilus assembly protein PilF